MKQFIAVVFTIFLTTFSSGCTTLADAQAAKGTGTVKIYDKPYDVVWNAVLESVNSSGLSLVYEDKEKGNILAQGGISAFSWGENVAIFVVDMGGHNKTRVEIVNKRAVGSNITAANWELRLFEAIDKRL